MFSVYQFFSVIEKKVLAFFTHDFFFCTIITYKNLLM